MWFDVGDGAERRHFRHAPGVQHGDAEILEAPDHGRRRGRAADHRAQPAQCFVFRRVFLDGLDDAEPDRRHAAGEGDLLRNELVDQARGVQMRPREDDFRAGHRRGVGDAPSVGVEHRHDREDAVVHAETQHVGLGADHRMQHHPAVRIDHALGVAGRPGGVAHGAAVGFVDCRQRNIAGAGLEEILVALHPLRHIAAEGNDDGPVLRHPVLELVVERQQNVIHDNDLVVGMGRDIADVRRAEPQVQRVHDAAGRRDAVIAFQVRGMVPGQCRHPVAFFHAGLDQCPGQFLRAVANVGIGVAQDGFVGPLGDHLLRRIHILHPCQQVIERQRIIHDRGDRAGHGIFLPNCLESLAGCLHQRPA